MPPIGPRMPSISKPRGAAINPRGPQVFAIARGQAGGPGEPPPGFLGHRNSVLEWTVYWALAKIFSNPINPRIGPFDGGWPDWVYQNPSPEGAGQEGSVIDFIVYNPGGGRGPTAIRVETEAFHLFAGSRKEAYDVMQRERLEYFYDVVDLYDTDLLGDPTGAKAVVAVKRALGLIERANPIGAGTALRASRLYKGYR